MSSCTFMASDRPLPKVVAQKEYPHIINIDESTIYDGGADDNFCWLAIRTKSMAYVRSGIIWINGQRSHLEYMKNALEYAG